jgi:glutamate synthase (NADPH/NADH) large chain
VHHHLIVAGMRSGCGLIVETGEAREIHHFCCLMGYGAGAVVPWLALASIDRLAETGRLGDTDPQAARENYAAAVGKGILKVMSKMGISTLQSYRGAQIFESVGLNRSVVDHWFTGTVSRIGGADMDTIAREIEARCQEGQAATAETMLAQGGRYRWRRDGESHQYNPETIPWLQQAVRQDDPAAWQRYRQAVQALNRQEGLIRGRFEFNPAGTPVALDEVEPWTDIVKRFKTGAMSYGSISQEAHETQAIAMNRMGGKSNSGEGGEDADRFESRSQRRLAQQRHQTNCLGTVWCHHWLFDQRRGTADQNGPGSQTWRRRAAARGEGLSLDRQHPPQHALCRAHLSAAPPRHLLHRRPGPADL